MQRVAVVTGGSRGIGLAIANKFLSEDFQVITVSRSEGELGALKKMYPDKIHSIFVDLSIKEEVIKAGEEIKKKADQIHVLVNNAGVFIGGEMHVEEDKIFELQMALNLNAAYYLSKALIPVMKKTENSYLFNICSTASLMAYKSGGAYSVSKHALLGLSRVFRQELMPFGIAVSSVLPGATYTDSWSGSGLPLERFMQASTIADAVWFAWQGRKTSVMEEILLRPLKGDI